METNWAGSDTESERLDDDDDDDADASPRHAQPLPVRTDASPPLKPAWNNVLALALAGDGRPPHVTPPAYVPSPDADTFVSPFAVLQSTDTTQSELCPQCAANVRDDPTADESPVDADGLLLFCLCCKRPLPRELLHGSASHAMCCVPCVYASYTAPDRLDALVAKLPSVVRIAADVDAAVRTQRAFMDAELEYSAMQEFPLDPRVAKIDRQSAASEERMDANVAKRRVAYRTRCAATLADVRAIYDEWLALESQRVSLNLQRLLVMDAFVCEQFRQSLAPVATFLMSINLTPGDPFPIRDEYDSSQQCSECEVLLSPTGPVIGNESVAVGFCDCCRRLVPQDDVQRRRHNSTISFCSSCNRRRGFSMISDANLVGIPDSEWCKSLAFAVNKFCHHVLQVKPHLGEALVGRLKEANVEVRVGQNRMAGLKRRLEAVVRTGDTPLDVSRHWYAEYSAACQGLVAAALKGILVSTEIGRSERDYIMWKPIISIVRRQDANTEHNLPEWLKTFVNNRWPASQLIQDDRPTATIAPKQTHQYSVPVAKPTDQPNVVAVNKQSTAATGTVVSANKPTPTAPKPKPMSTETTPQVPSIASYFTKPSNSVEQNATTRVKWTCERCAEVIQIPRSFKTGRKAIGYCDCCEAVLSVTMIRTPPIHPHVSLCMVCSKVQSTKSPEEVRKLAKRHDSDHMALASNTVNSLKSYLGNRHAPETRAAAAANTTRLSAEQDVNRWKKQLQNLEERQMQELAAKPTQPKNLRALYAEQVKVDAALYESMVKFVQMLLEIVNETEIVLSPKVQDMVKRTLKDPGSVVDHAADKGQGAKGTIVVSKSVTQNGVNHGSSKRQQPQKTHVWTIPRIKPPAPVQNDDRQRTRSRSRSPQRHHNREQESSSLSWSRDRTVQIRRDRDDADEFGRTKRNHAGREEQQRYGRDDHRRPRSRSRSRSRERRNGYATSDKRSRYYY